MTLKTLAAAACLSICTATAGLAATVQVTVRGIDYDVGRINGTFDEHYALLMDQVWWMDQGLATDFSLGFAGLLFAIEFISDSDMGVVYTYPGSPVASIEVVSRKRAYRYAIATPVSAVPLPAGGLLLVSAFGGIAALKRRKKGSA